MDPNKIKNARSVLKVIFYLIFFGSFWFMAYTVNEAYKAYKTSSYEKTEIEIVQFKILASGYISGSESSSGSKYPKEVFKATYKYNIDGKEYISSKMNASGSSNWLGEKDVGILFTRNFNEQFHIKTNLDSNPNDYLLISQAEDTKPGLSQYTPKKNYAYVNPKDPTESFLIHNAPEPLILAVVAFSIVICVGIGFAGYKLNLLKLA